MAVSNPVHFQTQDPWKRLKIFMFVGWVTPAVVVALSAGVGFPHGIYIKPQPHYKMCHKYGHIPTYDRCWLAPNTPIFYSSVIAPLALILLINFLIIVKTTHVMLKPRMFKERKPGTKEALKTAKSFFFLFFMLGGTWSFAFFTGEYL